jgi:hypothetical protein
LLVPIYTAWLRYSHPDSNNSRMFVTVRSPALQFYVETDHRIRASIFWVLTRHTQGGEAENFDFTITN